MSRKLITSRPFEKQLKGLIRSGQHAGHIKILTEELFPGLESEKFPPFSPDWDYHPLTGPWSGFHEVKLGGDTCVIFRLINGGTVVDLAGIGSHAQLKLK